MKKIKHFSAAMLLFLIAPTLVLSQANRQLSNLIAPTKINQHLWPGTKCTYDLGTNLIKWRYGYFCRGIGISPNNVGPSYPLDILNRDYGRGVSVVNTNFITTSNRIGVYSYSVSSGSPGYGYGVLTYGGRVGTYSINSGGAYTGSSYGVYATASGTAGTRYGVYAQATGSTGSRYGVKGYACAATDNFAAGVYGQVCDNNNAHWAGYFSGRVFSSAGFFGPSDRKLKTAITPLKNSLQQLMKLKPYVYQYKTGQYAKIGLPAGNQIGLIADEVKQVFPELVSEVISPAQYNEDETLASSEEKYEGVNYDGLIPVLIASLQEQQKTLFDLKAENDDLKARLTKLEKSLTLDNNPEKMSIAVKLNAAMLAANNPNPFNRSTVIRYYLPEESENAVVNISDANGRILKSISLIKKGNGQLVLDAGLLAAGTYQYSLIIGGNIVDTKKMILTR